MKKLLSFCDDPWSYEKFKGFELEGFLGGLGLDGVELMKWQSPGESPVPTRLTVGRHMLFWPVWLDFWRGDRAELLRQFGAEQDWQGYYMASSPEEFVAHRREELLDADRSGARYAVYHVSHVRLEDCRGSRYPYSNREVAEAFAAFLNRTLSGLEVTTELLLENHWYPGLTLLEPEICELLLDAIEYENLGFVLDISHLANTRPDLQSEEALAAYIQGVLRRLSPRVRGAIRAVHLNSNLAAEGRQGFAEQAEPSGHRERLAAAMRYVSSIDPHLPFQSPAIRSVLDDVNPEYLVNELSWRTPEELAAAVRLQMDAAFGPDLHG